MNLRKAARNQPCLIRLPGVCDGGGETTVLAHYRLSGYCGMGQKPADMPWGAFSCGPCHDRVDRRIRDMDQEFVRLAHAEACLKTIALLVRDGIIKC